METKKDFIAIAKIINVNQNKAYGYINLKVLVDELSKYYASQNPNFDKKKFSSACLN